MLEKLNEQYDNDPFETGKRFERSWEPERSDDAFEH